MTINRQYRLPAGEFFEERAPKDLLVLHHTVSGSFKSVWDYWNSDRNKDGSRRRVAVAFVVDKDGMVYELFDPACWAHHIGSPLQGNLLADKRSIGIEIVSEGGLVEHDGGLWWMDGKIHYKSTTQSAYRLDAPWRGYRIFDAYEEAQIATLEELVPDICQGFGIPKKLLPAADRTNYRPDCLANFNGILAHCNLRPDKSDVHPGFPWERLGRALL